MKQLGTVLDDMKENPDTPSVLQEALKVASDPYAYWRALLAGEKPAVHENVYHAGRWRSKGRGGSWTAFATWPDESGKIVGIQSVPSPAGGLDSLEIDVEQKWTWFCTGAVTEEQYDAFMETGRWWDDPPPRAKGSVIGDNLPTDPLERLTAEIAAEAETAAEFLATPITTQEQADMAAVWSKKIGTLAKEAEDTRKAEKQPHLDAGRDVDNRWREPIASAKDLVAKLKKHATPFLREQQRQLESAKAAEAARQGDEPVEASPVPDRAQAGRTGAKISLRKVPVAKVVDYAKAAQAMIDEPDLRLTIDKLARAALRDGDPAPDGVIYTTEEKAA